MKKSILVFVTTLLVFSIYAQKPVVTFYSEDGYKFWVIIDGKRVNPEPQSDVENITMDNDLVNVTIIFENSDFPDIEKSIRGVDANGNPVLTTWRIINTNRGKLDMRASSFQQLDETTITTHTTTTTIERSSVPPVPYQQPNAVPGYNGPIGCGFPMSDQNFSDVKYSISLKDFEDARLSIAKQVLKSNCLIVSQVKEIMMLFDFEETKIEFAKDAYFHTYDIGNYYQLNDAFEFELSVEELNEYINSLEQ
ncbi:MAG: DUF4476 domain-containing protein [Bacteroidetes bacterium]|nr:DUF4476 domain-containing protein [Bacteroidota bacterium]